jgi:hypothetical protein
LEVKVSFSRLSRTGALVWVLLLVARGAADEGTEVTGTGYASITRPADTADPPDAYTSSANEHDPENGESFTGPGVYELYQGEQADSRARGRATDFIKWRVNGATLRAEGTAHDCDPTTATKVSSEMWGMEVISASVSVADGAHALIQAANEISFEYAFTVSGPSIAERAVLLGATAIDVRGHPHTFSLTPAESEDVSRRESQRTGLRIGATTGGSAAGEASPGGLRIGGGGSSEGNGAGGGGGSAYLGGVSGGNAVPGNNAGDGQVVISW